MALSTRVDSVGIRPRALCGAEGVDREGGVAQARKPSLEATAGWTARARGHGRPSQSDHVALRGVSVMADRTG
jgi:hypothetical protein